MMVAAAERALTSYHWLGIPIAVAGAVLLALGTMFQHRGVENEGPAQGRGPGSMGGGRLQALLRKPVWLAGTVMLGAAILLQLTSLRFSPLIVVQPIGAVALVVTTLATVWATRTSPGPRVITSVALCVTGVAAFVTVAAVSAQDVQISDRHLVTILILLGVVLTVLGTGYGLYRRRWNAVVFTGAAGTLFGFVAALAKTVIARLFQGNFEWLSLTCLAGLAAAALFGTFMVQNAHARGTPELVVAGLTVIDPLVAVTIGITVLGEADAAPPQAFIGFALAGAIAVTGVIVLSTAKTKPASEVEAEPRRR
ncbi:multidrug DMT transporter permease [Paenarthrobacter sp. DKR-5]|uniref:multidrug DMT transporter permease n=1 Tax=Paenarthrobacter sp. DKR-5 TaxID=2835535 RepID=UPI00202932CA|nr:multidrug DMT transporter permease [Paenarthrobacter sp. DKR-5]